MQVLLGQRGLVRMMDGQDCRHLREPGEGNADDIVQVQHVDGRLGGVVHRPRRMIRIPEVRAHRIREGPLRMRIPPLEPTRHPRIAIGVHRHVMPARMELAREIRDEQLSSAISSRRHFDKWRRNQCDSQARAVRARSRPRQGELVRSQSVPERYPGAAQRSIQLGLRLGSPPYVLSYAMLPSRL
jgi:hypothetical protein